MLWPTAGAKTARPSAAVVAGIAAGPAHKGFAEVGGVTKAQGLGDVAYAVSGMTQLLDGDFAADFVLQGAEAGLLFRQPAAQSTLLASQPATRSISGASRQCA